MADEDDELDTPEKIAAYKTSPEHIAEDLAARAAVEQYAKEHCWCRVHSAVLLAEKIHGSMAGLMGQLGSALPEIVVSGIAVGTPELNRAFDNAARGGAKKRKKKPEIPVS